MNRRSRNEIVRDILILCKVPILSTHLMYKANTSWTEMKQITNDLIKKGLIQFDGKFYTVTHKGEQKALLLEEAMAI